MPTHIVLYTEFISTVKQQKERQRTFLTPHTPLTHAPPPTPSSGAGFDAGSKGWWSEVCKAWPLADVEEGRLVVCAPTLRVAVDTPDVEVEVEVLLVLDVEVEVEVETPRSSRMQQPGPAAGRGQPHPEVGELPTRRAGAWVFGILVVYPQLAAQVHAVLRRGVRHREQGWWIEVSEAWLPAGVEEGRFVACVLTLRVEVEVVLAVAEEAEVKVETPKHEVKVETPELEACSRAGAAAPGGGGTADATVRREFSGPEPQAKLCAQHGTPNLRRRPQGGCRVQRVAGVECERQHKPTIPGHEHMVPLPSTPKLPDPPNSHLNAPCTATTTHSTHPHLRVSPDVGIYHARCHPICLASPWPPAVRLPRPTR
ncbi:hypothetical protein B0H14DRAFT_3489392 [Mycena olivaceomarginata]|nr:hypothetical protein B0H14DRAFT_3489392 [Mycena olivaceomarginata]